MKRITVKNKFGWTTARTSRIPKLETRNSRDVFVLFAALNAMGYDEENAKVMTPVRKKVRNVLSGYGLEVICIRFGGVNEKNEIRFNEDPLYGKVLLYKEDFLQLLRSCIEVKKVPGNFAVFYAVSNVNGRVHDLSNFLNWKPNFPKE